MSEFKLYCDMDGVLVDFDKGYKKLTGNDMTAPKYKKGEEAIKALLKKKVLYTLSKEPLRKRNNGRS